MAVDANLTPRASQDHTRRNETPWAAKTNNPYADPPDSDAGSTIARSTLNSYAPSSIAERRNLLSGRRRLSVEHHLQKTTSRKAFVKVCEAVNLVCPIEINHEARSMGDSGLAKLAKAIIPGDRDGEARTHGEGGSYEMATAGQRLK